MKTLTKKSKVVPMMPIKNIKNFLSTVEEGFVDDMIGNIVMVDELELELPENKNVVSIKEEANALVCYAFENGLLHKFHNKNRLVDDNTIDNILDDSHYYIYNWLIMKFSVPSSLYAMIVHNTNAFLKSNEWDKTSPFENLNCNYQMKSRNEFDNDVEFKNALNFVAESLNKCSDDLKEYIDSDLVQLIDGQEWFYLNKEAIENNILMLQEHSFIKPFDTMYKENPNFLYTGDGFNELMSKTSNRVAEYLYFLSNLYKGEQL